MSERKDHSPHHELVELSSIGATLPIPRGWQYTEILIGSKVEYHFIPPLLSPSRNRQASLKLSFSTLEAATIRTEVMPIEDIQIGLTNEGVFQVYMQSWTTLPSVQGGRVQEARLRLRQYTVNADTHAFYTLDFDTKKLNGLPDLADIMPSFTGRTFDPNL